MSRVDWRRWLDVRATGHHGSIALEVSDDAQLLLEVTAADPNAEDSGCGRVLLDFSDAGLLLDWLREAMGVQLLLHGDGVAGAAVAGVQLAREHDTPPAGEGLSGPSASIRPRG